MSKKRLEKSTAKKEQFEVLLEDINGKFDFIAEHMSDHTKRLDRMEKVLTTQGEKIEVIQLDIQFIKNELKRKVDREEFQVLERRLSLLENKFAHSTSL